MTRERARELLPVIQAFADGKEIERGVSSNGTITWEPAIEPCWSHCYAYRIKPAPRELWLELTARGAVVAAYDIKPQDRGYHCIKVREVVE